MKPVKKSLSVARVAKLCGVSRGTVGYWLRAGKLHADRLGRNYAIPRDELLFFLKSTGQKIPDELMENGFAQPTFRVMLDCWQYWRASSDHERCQDCMVFENQVKVCFEARSCHVTRCARFCHDCRYYQELYFPRIQFIHQIGRAAAVFRDFCFWGGNEELAELCGLTAKELVGLGIEQVFHQDSLGIMIANAKRRILGDPTTPTHYDVFLKSSRGARLEVHIGVYPLKEPLGASLIVAQAV